MTGRARFALVLAALFAASCGLVWHRRAAWVVVAKEPGSLPGGCDQDTSIPWIHDPQKGSVVFADTGARIPLPKGLPIYQIRNFTPDRRLLVFHDERVRDYVVVDLETGRVLDFPGFAPGEVFPTTDGTRLILQHGGEAGQPRRYETRTPDGRLLHSLVLPPMEAPWKYGYLTWDGAYVVETLETAAPPVRVHAMATGESWTFEEQVVGLEASGRIWLRRGKVLRAYDLRARKELWSTSFAEDVVEAKLLDPEHLLVRAGDQSLSLYEAASGRLAFTLEEGERSAGDLYWHRLRTAGPRRFLQTKERLWDLETGGLLSWKPPECEFELDFFRDGRRALLSGTGDVPAVVDVDTGRVLFRFVPDGPIAEGEGKGRGLVAGSRVAASFALGDGWQVLLWERRHPEGTWGHLFRPEVWAAVLLGSILLLVILRG